MNGTVETEWTAGASRPSAPDERRRSTGRADWSRWPRYEAADDGLRDYWYPVAWSSEVRRTPRRLRICGGDFVLTRDADGTLSAVCGESRQQLETDEFLGLAWVFIGDREPHSLRAQVPEELVDSPPRCIGGRIEDRTGDWRLFAENGFDEGHAKYLHRNSYWRMFKTMPTWNRIHIEREGRWIYRVEDQRFWDAEFPGLGRWTNQRWWKIKPKQAHGRFLGNTGGARKNDPYIDSRRLRAFASLALPGMLRIAYPRFFHYEFYVPIEPGRTRYVGVMVQFPTGVGRLVFFVKYLTVIRWLFHGNFSAQDHWMVSSTSAPPERLYRPDISLLEWRRLVEEGNPFDLVPDAAEPAR